MTHTQLIARNIPPSRNPYEPANEPAVPDDCTEVLYSGTSREWIYYRAPDGTVWKRYEHFFAGRDASRTVYNQPQLVTGIDLSAALAADERERSIGTDNSTSPDSKKDSESAE